MSFYVTARARALLLAIPLAFTVACGESNNGWVKGVEVDAYNQNGELQGEVLTKLDTGGMFLPDLSLPILANNSVVGQFTLRPSLEPDVSKELIINVNLSQAANVPGGNLDPLLPNGLPLPVGGINPDNLIVLPIADSQSRVYLEIDTRANRAVVGVAVPLENFDGLGGGIGPINFFPSFQLDNGINGNFGIFTGPQAGQNGFALFVDASSMLGSKSFSRASHSGAIFQNLEPDRRSKRKIERGLYNMSRKGEVLELY